MRRVPYLDLDLSQSRQALSSARIVDPASPVVNVRGLRGGEISYLTSNDIAVVAEVEKAAYLDNPILLHGLVGLRDILVAKDVANATRELPNLSFCFRSSRATLGYLIAYEGVRRKRSNGVRESIIYVADWATRSPKSFAGARIGSILIQTFVQQYQREYLDRHCAMPILAKLREHTSRKLLMRRIERIADGCGVAVDIEDEQIYVRGNDRIYQTIIRPRFGEGTQ
jgi:hypothetical protein